MIDILLIELLKWDLPDTHINVIADTLYKHLSKSGIINKLKFYNIAVVIPNYNTYFYEVTMKGLEIINIAPTSQDYYLDAKLKKNETH